MQIDTKQFDTRVSKAWGKIGFAKKSVSRELLTLNNHAFQCNQRTLTAKPRLVAAKQPLKVITLEQFLAEVA